MKFYLRLAASFLGLAQCGVLHRMQRVDNLLKFRERNSFSPKSVKPAELAMERRALGFVRFLLLVLNPIGEDLDLGTFNAPEAEWGAAFGAEVTLGDRRRAECSRLAAGPDKIAMVDLGERRKRRSRRFLTINCSAWRREATPARAMIFCKRSCMGRVQ